MLTKADLQALATLRLADAALLLREGRHSSAYYLAGYAIEMAIKACIAKLIFLETILDLAFVKATYVHNLDGLINTAGLRPAFGAAMKHEPRLGQNWAIVGKWSVESRYLVWDPFEADSLIAAIQDPQTGVFEWLRQRW